MPLLDDDGSVNPSQNRSLTELIEEASHSPGRRVMLRSGAGFAALSFLGLTACGSDGDPGPLAISSAGGSSGTTSVETLSFKAVATSSGSNVVVPDGYVADVLLRWGDPVLSGAPAFKGDASETSAAAQGQAGDNFDGNWYFPFTNSDGTERADAGLFVTNHEYINPEYYYAPGSDTANWLNPFTLEKARKAQAGHGISVVEVRRQADGRWEVVRSSPYNRRITGYSPIAITGPAKGDALLKTAANPGGDEVLGTLNNCAAGHTPWGTYLTCEENFNGYFGWNGSRTPNALENRYGITQTGFGYRWHEVDPRFDVNATPNEPNRFGWVVEVDPFSTTSKPKKRTALGRFKHENAEVVVAANGKAVVYMGCDERNEYLYKFISDGTFSAANPASGRDLLDAGTLYVARLSAGAVAGDRAGDGVWIPLVHASLAPTVAGSPNPLNATNGFLSQADVLIRARQAADRVGATMMDRPEWVAANPKKPGEVFLTLTNNNRRGTTPASSNKVDGTTSAGSSRPAVDDANPRVNNVWGHILRWNEAGADPTALSFAWDVFLLAGNPKKYPDRTDLRSGSAGLITPESMFNSPDGLAIDRFGRMWIQTDGSYANTGEFDGQGNNQMLAFDAATGTVKRFLVGPDGCEVTGLSFTPDMKAMFVGIQHPGELGGPNQPKKPDGTLYAENDIAREPTRFSKWPDGASATRPRSATIVVRRSDGGVVGS